ncbi:MAG: hypothetical protein QM725_06400 [Lacibacter sp.]
MRKATAILFLTIYLFSSTELRQLAKLPILVQHYFEHKSQNSDITFAGFLAMHYEKDIIIDNDFAKDQQLPFKSHHDCQFILSVAYVPATSFTTVIKPVSVETVKHVICNDDFINSVYLSSVWQPPKA